MGYHSHNLVLANVLIASELLFMTMIEGLSAQFYRC